MGTRGPGAHSRESALLSSQRTREPEVGRCGQPLPGRGRQVVSVSIPLQVSQEPRVIPNSNTTSPVAHCTCQPDDGTGKIKIGRVRTVISAQSELGRLGLVATRRPWAVGWNPRCLPGVCARSTASQHPINLESNTRVLKFIFK